MKWTEYQDQEIQIVGAKLEELNMLAEAGVLAEVNTERIRLQKLVAKVREYLQTMPVLTAFEVTTLLQELGDD